MKSKIVIILSLGLLLLVAGCTSQTQTPDHPMVSKELSDSEIMMALHCDEMRMPGCEEFDNIELSLLQVQKGCEMMPTMAMCDSIITEDNNNELIDRSIVGLENAKKTQVIELSDRDSFELTADIIKKEINGQEIRMLGYNGQIPGPLLKVKQNSEVDIKFINNLDMPTTVHWHGLRLHNEFDGVPKFTQEEVLPGGSFNYTLTFPDEGIYWYHPHVREDLQQELGLYGNMLVEPIELDYYNQVNGEEVLVLDDIYLEGNDVGTFFEDNVNHVVMGRFGNLNLINGEEDYSLVAKKGEVRRFYITNVANVRTYNFSIEGVQMKLIGSDSGTYEKESYVDSVIISPSERAIVELYFEDAGEFNIINNNPVKRQTLGKIIVLEDKIPQDYSSEFLSLRENEYVKAQIDEVRDYFDKEVDYTITLDIQMGGMDHSMMEMEESHEDIEWEDTMPMMRGMTNESTTWILKDNESGLENMEIDYDFKVGDKVKIRLYNDPHSMHPMQHPIHFHGQRFLVLEKDGVSNENLAWKDTVLVPIGSTVDILLDVTNPGDWMAHCHIAEHLQGGMMMKFSVE